MYEPSDRLKRWSVLLPTMVLPRPLRVSLRERGLRRLELERARGAALLIVGHPKSGNTWLRTMVSRLYQVRHGLASDFVVKTDELHRRNPSIPRILATNGHYSYEGVVGDRLDVSAPRGELHEKPVVLLVRHPCDIAVSWYHQVTKRQSSYKYELINHSLAHPIDRQNISMWDFVRHSDIGVPFLIDFLNRWERNVARVDRALIVRYEDLRVDTAVWLKRITDLMGAGFDEREIAEAVDWASFDSLRKMEAAGQFRTGGLTLRDPGDAGTFKTRRAKVGGYRDDLTPEQVAELDALVAARLSPRLGYTAGGVSPALGASPGSPAAST